MSEELGTNQNARRGASQGRTGGHGLWGYITRRKLGFFSDFLIGSFAGSAIAFALSHGYIESLMMFAMTLIAIISNAWRRNSLTPNGEVSK